ncbi:hypothetical protein H7Y63_01760 [Polaromonas sp.]|nr:hypothetical protein [Candidatus Saccharibacteria bacterium]
MKQSVLAQGLQPQFEAANLAAVAELKRNGRVGTFIFFQEPVPAQPPVIGTRPEFIAYAQETNTATAVAFRGWRRLQALYTAKVQFQTVSLESKLPIENPIIFRNTPPLPYLRPEVPAGWTTWEMSLDQLDVYSLQDFMHQIDYSHDQPKRFKYIDTLGENSGPRTFDLLRGFAELKLNGANE